MSAPETTPETIEQNGQKLVLVSTIKTVEANREFQNNVNVVQNQRNIAVELKRRIDQALTEGERQQLKARLDETVKSLDQNNALMTKTYGFSLMRNYVISFVKTLLYTPLTDEEVAKMKQDGNAGANATKTFDGKEFAFIATITGVAENDIFRQNVQLVQAQRQRLVGLKQALEKAPAGEEKQKLEEEFKKSEETLVNNNNEMVKRYGFSLMRNYLMEVEEAKLYTALTPDEAKNMGKSSAPAA